MITVMGKAKWIKIIYDNASYENVVECVNTPDEAMKLLKDLYLVATKQYKS
jgi:hypothetical protein